ncbi:zinc ribbon domain-containing protein [Streptomyces sp. NPDC088253]|uniref:zinc ribbon domain-containing protein n=1 Tax=Streptomyces sp. NPDC088253 TaxID=3365846 RepID=UPI00383025B3
MLEYKAVRHGRTFAEVDRAFPSSQVCSACGFRYGPRPLHVREWTCGACGTVRDRDHSAARDVLSAPALGNAAPSRSHARRRPADDVTHPSRRLARGAARHEVSHYLATSK